MIKRVHQLSHKRLMQFPQKTVTNIFCPKMMFSLSKLTKIKGFLFTNFHKVGSGKKKIKKSVALLPRQNVWSCSLHGLFTKAIFYLYFWERLSPKIPYTYLLFLLNKHSSCKHNYSTYIFSTGNIEVKSFRYQQNMESDQPAVYESDFYETLSGVCAVS